LLRNRKGARYSPMAVPLSENSKGTLNGIGVRMAIPLRDRDGRCPAMRARVNDNGHI